MKTWGNKVSKNTLPMKEPVLQRDKAHQQNTQRMKICLKNNKKFLKEFKITNISWKSSQELRQGSARCASEMKQKK